MSQMETFRNTEFGSVRIIEDEDRYLFCGTDVATALGYSNPRKAVRDHTKGGTKCSTLTAGGIQTMTFVPEGDVYRLIAHSKLPSSVRFERWIFDEVLPCIRKSGAYITQDKLLQLATSPETIITLCQELLSERARNTDLMATNNLLASKAKYYDLFVDTCQCTNIRITAKELNVPEKRFVHFLLTHHFVYRSPSGTLLPYAKKANTSLFIVKDFYCNGCLGSYTLITPVGKNLFSKCREDILTCT